MHHSTILVAMINMAVIGGGLPFSSSILSHGSWLVVVSGLWNAMIVVDALNPGMHRFHPSSMVVSSSMTVSPFSLSSPPFVVTKSTRTTGTTTVLFGMTTGSGFQNFTNHADRGFPSSSSYSMEPSQATPPPGSSSSSLPVSTKPSSLSYLESLSRMSLAVGATSASSSSSSSSSDHLSRFDQNHNHDTNLSSSSSSSSASPSLPQSYAPTKPSAVSVTPKGWAGKSFLAPTGGLRNNNNLNNSNSNANGNDSGTVTGGAFATTTQKNSGDGSTTRENTLRSEQLKQEQQQQQEADIQYIQQWLPAPGCPWTLLNSFELFLTQCSVQSFLFLLQTCRDPHTVRWFEGFTQPVLLSGVLSVATSTTLTTTTTTATSPDTTTSTPTTTTSTTPSSRTMSQHSLLSFHGLGVWNTTRFPDTLAFFTQLLKQPVIYYEIESPLKHIPTYELEINPARLGSRLLSVRTQIAREMIRDLGVLASLGREVLEQYWERIKLERTDPVSQRDDDPEGSYDRAPGMTTNSSPSPRSSSMDQGRPPAQNLLFLEFDPTDEVDSEYIPSPLRKGNFDLVQNLATQESIHRLLNDPHLLQQANRVYLQRFYLDRLETHFLGSQGYGRANDFVQQLLHETPSAIPLDDRGETMGLCDPTHVAEMLLEQRQKVAMEWKTFTENVILPVAHVDIQRLLLNRLLQLSPSQ